MKVELLYPLLGTAPKNKDVYATYVASKAPKIEDGEGETETVEEVEERGWQGFHMMGKGEARRVIIYDYVVKGFLKSALEALMAMEEVPKVPAYKKWIDKCVFAYPREITVKMGEPDGVLERSLRGITAQGERVTLVRSDFVEAGTRFGFEVEVLRNVKGITAEVVRKCLAYGKWVGLGGWRGSGGYGRFTCEVEEVTV